MRRAATVVLVSGLSTGMATAAAPPKPAPSSVTIAVAGNPVVFGSSVAITGQATGTKIAGAEVTLYAKPAPYATGFKAVRSTTTDAAGHYSLRTAPSVNTDYYVSAKTTPPATSAQVLVKVRVNITLRVSTTRPAAGLVVRFFGFMLPAYNTGNQDVTFQRWTGRRWRPVFFTRLKAATPTSTVFGVVARSRYSKRQRILKSGKWRVWFDPNDGLRIAGASPTRTLIVH